MKAFLGTSVVLLCGLSALSCESNAKPEVELSRAIEVQQLEAPKQTEGGSVSPMLRPPAEIDQCEAQSAYVAPVVLRRLTRLEYKNTARSLLGVDLDELVDGFPPEEEVNGFDNQSKSLQVSALHVEQFMGAAEKLSDLALSRLEEISPCVPMAEDAERCISRFIESFGRRAWRRPLTEEEQSRLLSLYRAGV